MVTLKCCCCRSFQSGFEGIPWGENTGRFRFFSADFYSAKYFTRQLEHFLQGNCSLCELCVTHMYFVPMYRKDYWMLCGGIQKRLSEGVTKTCAISSSPSPLWYLLHCRCRFYGPLTLSGSESLIPKDSVASVLLLCISGRAPCIHEHWNEKSSRYAKVSCRFNQNSSWTIQVEEVDPSNISHRVTPEARGRVKKYFDSFDPEKTHSGILCSDVRVSQTPGQRRVKNSGDPGGQSKKNWHFS